MNARLLVTALLGVAIGAAAVSFNPLHSAPAPEPRVQRWEYKVVYISSTARGLDDKPADVLTDQLNTLAKDGWEYAGPVMGDSMGRGGGGGGRNYVAFRRFKP